MLNITLQDVITNGVEVYCPIINPTEKVNILVRADGLYYKQYFVIYEDPKEHTFKIMEYAKFKKDYKLYDERDVDMFRKLETRLTDYLERKKAEIPNFKFKSYYDNANEIIRDIFKSNGIFIEYYGCSDDPYGMGQNEHCKLLNYFKSKETDDGGSAYYKCQYIDGMSEDLHCIFKQWTSEIIKLDVLKQYHYLERCL